MKLSELRERVRNLTGIRLQGLRSDSQIDAVINESYEEIVNMLQWPFLRDEQTVTVASGQASFEMPSVFSEVQSITYSSDTNTQARMMQTTLDELDFLQDDSGDPAYYARIDDRNFKIWPKPTSQVVLTVRGKKSVERLDSWNDEPVFAEQFHPIIAYRSASRILAEEGDDSGRSEFYQLEANNYFGRMQQFYMRSSDVTMIVMGSGKRRKYIDAYRGRSAGRL